LCAEFQTLWFDSSLVCNVSPVVTGVELSIVNVYCCLFAFSVSAVLTE